jgi:SAM-dependent methyltransferase
MESPEDGMKDVVENRQLVSFGRKLRIARIALEENGPAWCFLMLLYYASSTVSHKAFATMDRLRRTRGIPGLNSRRLNKEIWEAWDWNTSGGEEWSATPQSKEGLIRFVLEPEIPEGGRILEIGPGGGRWTGALIARAREYLGIDISATCVEHCRRRFADEAKARFAVGSGADLAGVEDSSIDAIWSFDVFVHINVAEVEGYAAEFRRVLRPGGVGVIHHGGVGGATGGWRSNVTGAAFEEILKRSGL